MANEPGVLVVISDAVVVKTDPTDRNTRYVGEDAVAKVSHRINTITGDTLKQNFENVSSTIGSVVSAAFAKTFEGLRMDSLEVSLAVEADGTIGILGTGVSVKGSSSIKLTFKRQ